MNTRFYVVRDLDFQRNPPTVHHDTLDSAKAQALNLGSKANGTFHIVQVIGAIKVSTRCLYCNRALSVFETNYCGNCGASRVPHSAYEPAL